MAGEQVPSRANEVSQTMRNPPMPLQTKLATASDARPGANRVNRLVLAALGDRRVISVQNPVRLDNGSEPQPDIAVLHAGAERLGAPTPHASEVLLLIEVADSTLHEDRATRRHCTRRVVFQNIGSLTSSTK